MFPLIFNMLHNQKRVTYACMFLKLTLRDSATTCLKLILVTEIRSIVITSLYNLKSVYFWHSIKKWIAFSTQSTVHCLQSLSVGGGTGDRYPRYCFNFELMASNSKFAQ